MGKILKSKILTIGTKSIKFVNISPVKILCYMVYWILIVKIYPYIMSIIISWLLVELLIKIIYHL